MGDGIRNIPGVNHPIFKGQMINKDPREVYLSKLFAERGEINIFHAFYSDLVQALYDNGVTANVFCVNIDAVIAALLLKLLWPRYRSGEFSEAALETLAFTAFLFGRTVGCAEKSTITSIEGEIWTPALRPLYVRLCPKRL